jgi:carbonic anhydrase
MLAGVHAAPVLKHQAVLSDIQPMPRMSSGVPMAQPLVSLIALAAGLCLMAPTARAGGHGAAEDAAAKPAAQAEAKPEAAAASASAGDPMDRLRARLAERLGAVKAPEAASPNVLRVANKVDKTFEGDPVINAGHSVKPARPRKVTEPSLAAALAAAHRAGVPSEPVDAGHAAAPAHAAHWDYQGEGGPQAWGDLKPEFKACSTGQRQSPIDIRDGIQVQLEAISFDYRPSSFTVIDNGHTVQVNVGSGNSISVGGRRYELLQFHFHRPSEERINGRQFDMVAHLVHKGPEGRLAVVAVLLDRGSVQPIVQAVWNALPLEKHLEVPAPVAINLNQLLPDDKRYYTYMGSLTTPPCSEGVLWMVMKQPVPIAPEQINIFTRLYPMNARPIQQASGRLIKESN